MLLELLKTAFGIGTSPDTQRTEAERKRNAINATHEKTREMRTGAKKDQHSPVRAQTLDDYVLAKAMNDARTLGTDLVEIPYKKCCCESCAKYRGRIFSISGRNRQFPRLPQDLHTNCGLIPSPFVFGVDAPLFCKTGQEIAYSNRPFVDDRSPKEKADYKEWALMMEREETKDADRAIYEQLCIAFPNDVPKSFAAFRHAKNSNADSYRSLIAKAKKYGIDF